MKKKILIVLFSLVCTLCLTTGLTACNNDESGNDGKQNSGQTGGETEHVHENAEAVTENRIEATCTEDGSYDSVIYCSTCGEEISRETITITASGHTEATKTDNETAVTCTENGSYDTVIYCSVCGEEFSRETTTIPATGHVYNGNWTCTVCGNSLTASEGLDFTPSDGGESYILSGIGTCADADIIIPWTYNGLPVTSIAASAFTANTTIESVTIPDSITSIGLYAFAYSNIKSVNLGNGLTSITNYAFCYCYMLENIVIGSALTEFDLTAFIECSSIKSIEVSENNTTYKTIDGNLYSYDGATFVYCATGKTQTSFVVPDGVTTIAADAFFTCTALENIVIPDGVTYIGREAFYGCTALESIVIPDSVTYIGSNAFTYCSALKNVYFTGTAEQINQIEIGSNNTALASATIYCYAESGSATESGNYWYYDADGNIVTWTI